MLRSTPKRDDAITSIKRMLDRLSDKTFFLPKFNFENFYVGKIMENEFDKLLTILA